MMRCIAKIIFFYCILIIERLSDTLYSLNTKPLLNKTYTWTYNPSWTELKTMAFNSDERCNWLYLFIATFFMLASLQQLICANGHSHNYVEEGKRIGRGEGWRMDGAEWWYRCWARIWCVFLSHYDKHSTVAHNACYPIFLKCLMTSCLQF